LPYTARFAKEILANGERLGFGVMIPYLRWLNTGYVISEHPLRDPSPILLAADRIHLYRTRDPGRRAWIVHHATAAPSEARLLQRLKSDPAGLMESVALLDPGVRGERAKREDDAPKPAPTPRPPPPASGEEELRRGPGFIPPLPAFGGCPLPRSGKSGRGQG